MVYKDIRRNIWFAYLPLLLNLVLAGPRLLNPILHSDLMRGGIQETVEVSYQLLLHVLYPMMTFLLGFRLHQEESWELVWSFPFSRSWVLGRKLLAAGALLLAGVLPTLAFLYLLPGSHSGVFSFTLLPPLLRPAILPFMMLVMLSFLFMGMIMGMGSRHIHEAAALTLVSLFLVPFGVAKLLFPDDFLEALARIDGLKGFLMVSLVLGLLCGLIFMTARFRLYRPLSNALVASGTITVVLLTTLSAGAFIGHRAESRFGTNRNVWWKARLGSGSAVFLCGYQYGPGWLDAFFPACPLPGMSGWNWHRADLSEESLASLDQKLNRAECLEVSQDGNYISTSEFLSFTKEGNAFTVRIFRPDGRLVRECKSMAWRTAWKPGTHQLFYLQEDHLEAVDADSGARMSIPLPDRMVLKGSDEQKAVGISFLESGTLVLQKSLNEGKSISLHYLRSGSSSWMAAGAGPFSLDSPSTGCDTRELPRTFRSERSEMAPEYQSLGWCAQVPYRMAYTESGGQFRTAKVWAGRETFNDFLKFNDGVLCLSQGQISLLNWGDSRLLWKKEMNGYVTGISHGNTALLIANSKNVRLSAGEWDSRGCRSSLFFLDVPSATLTRVTGAPWDEREAPMFVLLDSRGRYGLMCGRSPDDRDCMYVIDMEKKSFHSIQEFSRGFRMK